MTETVSKSRFKPRALEYFRKVQRTGRELIITERGRPLVKIVPFSVDVDEALRSLRMTVLSYQHPTEPVGLEDWEATRTPPTASWSPRPGSAGSAW